MWIPRLSPAATLVAAWLWSLLAVSGENASTTIGFADMYTGSDSRCRWMHNASSLEVYWINMEKSVHRKEKMSAHLDRVVSPGKHFRVRGITLDDMYIPNDVKNVWDHFAQAIFQSNSINLDYMRKEKKSILISGLYGRKKNKLRELGCTMTHLFAIKRAIESTTATSRYALILEDDVQIPYQVDYDALAKTAPEGFGILQLFNSNEGTMSKTWFDYKTRRKLWFERFPGQFIDFWSTCGYLIDRVVMKEVIDKLLVEKSFPGTKETYFDVKMIAGVKGQCTPKNSPCCPTGAERFQPGLPCVSAPRGIQADSYVYCASPKTYVLSVPIMTNGFGGNSSTFHQDHVLDIHKTAFRKQRSLINEMLTGEMQKPEFLQPACGKLVLPEIDQQVRTMVDCKYEKKEKWRKSGMLDVYRIRHTVDRQLHHPASLVYQDVHNTVKSVAQHENYEMLTKASKPHTGTAKSVSDSHYEAVLGVPSETTPHVHVVHTLKTEQMYVPADVMNTWDSSQCLLNSQNAQTDLKNYQQKVSSVLMTREGWSLKNERVSDTVKNLQSASKFLGGKVLLSGLCGRGQTKAKDVMEDVAITASHLLAIYKAVHSLDTDKEGENAGKTPRYALILEDDVQFPFDIDFGELIKGAPKDFGILELTSTDSVTMSRRWNHYKYDQTALWANRTRVDDAWGVSAYIIDKVSLRPYIDALVSQSPGIFPVMLQSYKKASDNQHILDFFEMKVIAGMRIHDTCVPEQCCTASEDVITYSEALPCAVSHKGLAVDRFMNAVFGDATKVSNMPLVINGIDGFFNASYHARMRYWPGSEKGLNEQRRIVRDMISGDVALPKYMQPSCDAPIPWLHDNQLNYQY